MPCVRTDSACAANEDHKLAMEPEYMDTQETAVSERADARARDRQSKRLPVTLIPPSEHLVSFSTATTHLQVSVHTPGRHLLRELAMVFPHYREHCVQAGLTAQHAFTFDSTDSPDSSNPSTPLHSSTSLNKPDVSRLMRVAKEREKGPAPFDDHLLIVKTFQRSQSDLMVVNETSNSERNLLLECFSSWGRYVITRIRSHGFWADMTDPASGYPAYTPRGTSLYPDVDGSAILLKYPTHLVSCCRIVSHPVWGTRNYPATLFTTCPADLLSSILNDSYQIQHAL
ncbi:hypothetical protein HDU81_003491 [Chytriomyces hyalinus]|nr:hypothetical protein HDU81_003491 [Chytriomyces hyalinus]